MTNREKLRELFPYLNIVGTVFIDKRTEQVLAASVNFNWLNTEYEEPTTKNDLGVDAVSRQAVLELIADDDLSMGQVVKGIHALPSVTPQPMVVPIAEVKIDKDKFKELANRAVLSVIPQEPKCKDCKWWKDSDGKYRRGCGAESICRINTDKVYQGEGYCYMFEPQESEVKDGNDD